MTPESPAARPPRRRTPRVPPFCPVPLRSRRDGWSAEIQAWFLALLAVTGSVSDAAERVGMSRNGAYRLRRRPGAESFAAAWDAALGAPVRKVTVDDEHFLAFEGLIQPLVFRGRYLGFRQKPDNSKLLRMIGRLDERVGRSTADAGER